MCVKRYFSAKFCRSFPKRKLGSGKLLWKPCRLPWNLTSLDLDFCKFAKSINKHFLKVFISLLLPPLLVTKTTFMPTLFATPLE